MKNLITAACILLLASPLTACEEKKADEAATPAKSAATPAKADGDKAAAKPAEAEAKPAAKTAEAKPAADPKKEAAVAADNNDPYAAPADVAAPPADAKKTASGLAYKVLKPGSGDKKPTAEATVKVHYTGWQSSDGRMFDSSAKRGQPASFPLNRVIKGWTEGLQLMVTGEKTRFWIPAGLAYGETAKRPGGPAGMLVFDVELLEFNEPVAIPVPEDVKAAPADAKATDSGLKYKVLTAGKGEKKPAATDTVEVHYSGWTTDGKMFDSSVRRGQPATFPLNRVIKGWTEGLQLMVEGEKTRFWIPADLAYGETPSRPGAPAGTLVFDVELLKIK